MFTKWNRWGTLPLAALCIVSAAQAGAATFTVDSVADSGAGTLRAAIESANATLVEDTIQVTLSAGAVIAVDSDLPTITRPVIIETSTPHVVLTRSETSTATRGIAVTSGTDSVTISGLEVSNFPVGITASGIVNLFNMVVRVNVGDGIQLANGTAGVIGRADDLSPGCAIYSNGGNGITYGAGGKLPSATVRNNLIGLSGSGEIAGNSGAGIEIRGTLADFEHYIFENRIAGNLGAGIYLHDADATRLVIGGNVIGLGLDDSPAGNSGGIDINNVVGALIGEAGGELFGRDPNTINGNLNYGVRLAGATSSCSLARNGITGNVGPGVLLGNAATNNIITANTFQENTGAAIEVAGDSCLGNDFTSNVFDENGALITLVDDAHNDILPPVTTVEADRVTAVGLPLGQSVEWYFDDGAGSLFPIGFGISQLFLENLSSYLGGQLRAIATDINNGSSALSEPITVEPPADVLEDGCDEAVAYDDDTPAELLSLPEDASLGGFVMLFEPPTPFHVQRICVSLQAAADGPFLGAVAVYVNNGGVPGGLIRRVPFGVNLTTTATRYSIDVTAPRISFDSGSVFVGLLYDQDAYPGVALTADTGEGVTPRPLFRSTDGGTAWDPFANIPLALDVIGTRLAGEETGCTSGIVVDDGTFEGSIGPSSIKSGFAISATPPVYPYQFTGTCLRLHAPVQSATLSATLRVFAYDGSVNGENQPLIGSELAAIPLEAVPLTNAPSWYYFDFGANDVTITEGSAFFRLDWVSTTINGDNEQLFYNNTNATQSQVAYVRAASDGSYVPMTVLFPTFRSFAWRLEGGVAVAEGEGVNEGIVEGGLEGTVDGEGVLEGEGNTEGSLEGSVDGEGTTEGVVEGVVEGSVEGSVDGETPVSNSADYDGNFVISLSELIRLVQLYNAGGFGCDEGTEDGFAPESSDQSCAPHSADYVNQDWEISLSELLRLIQLYTLGGYTVCESEDGFCAVS